MDYQHLAVELDESGHEQDKHIKISYKSLAWILSSLLVLVLIALGAFTSYLNMFWKAQSYVALETKFDQLRNKVHVLEKEKQRSALQMNTLENLASNLASQYDLNAPTPNDLKPMDDDDTSAGSVKESIQEFNLLKVANFSHIFHHYAHQFQSQVQPSLWPVNGVLRSSFGSRRDPFSGEGAFHSGVDLTAAIGTPVHVTADGVVEAVGSSGRYGRLVIIDHGGGLRTYYAHLSHFMVVPGQEVRRNEVIALSGSSGRVTGPHLHYEVRVRGAAVNPYKYLGLAGSKTEVASSGKAHNDLGL